MIADACYLSEYRLGKRACGACKTPLVHENDVRRKATPTGNNYGCTHTMTCATCGMVNCCRWAKYQNRHPDPKPESASHKRRRRGPGSGPGAGSAPQPPTPGG